MLFGVPWQWIVIGDEGYDALKAYRDDREKRVDVADPIPLRELDAPATPGRTRPARKARG